MADPSEMLICSNQSFPEGYLCCNPSLFISQPAKAPVICGIYGGLAGPPLLKKMGITDPRAAGFALGINSHAGGIARAFEIDATMGSYASLAMCLNAVFTSIILPWIILII